MKPDSSHAFADILVQTQRPLLRYVHRQSILYTGWICDFVKRAESKYPEVTRLTFFPVAMLISCRTDSDAIVHSPTNYIIFINPYPIYPAELGIDHKNGDLGFIACTKGDSGTWEYI